MTLFYRQILPITSNHVRTNALLASGKIGSVELASELVSSASAEVLREALDLAVYEGHTDVAHLCGRRGSAAESLPIGSSRSLTMYARQALGAYEAKAGMLKKQGHVFRYWRHRWFGKQ